MPLVTLYIDNGPLDCVQIQHALSFTSDQFPVLVWQPLVGKSQYNHESLMITQAIPREQAVNQTNSGTSGNFHP